MIIGKSTFKQLMKEGGGRFKSVNAMGNMEYGYKEIKCGTPLNIYVLSNGIIMDVVFGKKIFIDYRSIEDVKAYSYNGKLDILFCENDTNIEVVIVVASKLDIVYNAIRQNANLGYKEIEKGDLQQPQSVTINYKNVSSNNSKSGVTCPKCGSHEIQVISNEANMKSSTSLNINPLKPFTVFNHKKKAKVSKAKVGAAILTGGASLLVTGIKNNKNLEVFCTSCGHRWKMK